MIYLREVSKENFWECVELEVADDQKAFVTSNAVSLAQSKYQPECIPLGIFLDDQIIGFAMYCIDEDDGEYWIYRMMIDKNHQGRGYGKKALRILLETIKKDKLHHKIYLGVHKESAAAVRLYTDFGFEFNGQVFGSEHIMMYEY